MEHRIVICGTLINQKKRIMTIFWESWLQFLLGTKHETSKEEPPKDSNDQQQQEPQQQESKECVDGFLNLL